MKNSDDELDNVTPSKAQMRSIGHERFLVKPHALVLREIVGGIRHKVECLPFLTNTRLIAKRRGSEWVGESLVFL